ncbi:MAG: hypothetical protein Q8O38_13460 [Sulfurimicrobium sp.]|nr:hypothetical protein [Sulfurimicrobium sp.]
MTNNTAPGKAQQSNAATTAASSAVPETSTAAEKSAAKPTKRPAKSAVKPAAKQLASAAPKAAATVAPGPAPKAADATAATAANKPAAKPAAKADKNAKPKNAKLIRDGFTMPETEYDLIAAVKKRCVANGLAVKKSEVLRAAIIAFAAQSDAAVTAAMQALDVIKTGRPPKGHK